MKRTVLFSFILIIACISCEKKPIQEEELPMENISYGDHARQKMDISLPTTANTENKAAIVLCIHGGSWSAGDKKDFDWIKQAVNNYNLAYVTINYRLLQDNVTYRQMLDDIHAAITYLKNNSNAYHLKTDKMCIFGSSAGGHLGLLYTYSMTSPIPIACVTSQAGPTDFSDPGQIELNGTEMLLLMNKLLGTQIMPAEIKNPGFSFPEPWYDASPIYHVNKNTAPTILAYGVKDELVSYTNAVRLNDTLQKYGIDHSLITFPNSGHELNNDPGQSQQYWSTLMQFIDNYLLN